MFSLFVLGLAVGRGSALGGLEGLSLALVASAIANAAINMAMVRKLVASPFREQIGLVGQEPTLFATSIRENVRFGKPDATDQERTCDAELPEETREKLLEAFRDRHQRDR